MSLLGEAAKRKGRMHMQKVFEPVIKKTISACGFVHPGVGLTAEMLENVRYQLRRGAEPWKSYFEAMLESDAASRNVSGRLTDPERTSYNSQAVNGMFIRDALTVYTQAILYYVTGDNVYRKNALEIIRRWSRLDPQKYRYFKDACIHVGIPMNRMCMGAEILRRSTYRVTEGYKEADLLWTEEEILHFEDHLVRPAVAHFMSSCDEFMNQHLYTVIGAMSAYLFMDDKEGYAKTVEWFTVNKKGKNPGFNGSVKRLFREIATVDEIGETEGSGKPLPSPVIQHVEMGRDQAHGCGDLTNAAILARLMYGQGTKVDPVEGTISASADAVGAYEFLDDRILKAADFFFRYMLGYEAEWVQVPFSIRDGKIADNYMAFSSNYRGRYRTINFWDLYVHYTVNRPEIDLEKEYPYFYEGFMKKIPSNHFSGGKKAINWDNADGGGDFWLFLPPEMAGDDKLLAKPQNDYQVRAADRGVMTANREAMAIRKEDGTEYVRFSKALRESRLAITNGGVERNKVAFHIRTDGRASLWVDSGEKIWLPDTAGQWEYVIYTKKTGTFSDLYYVNISDIKGTYVDLDAIDIKPDEQNAWRRIDIVEFEHGHRDENFVTYAGAPFSVRFGVRDGSQDRKIVYSGSDLPKGAVVHSESGLIQWTPEKTGESSFYLAAKENATSVLKKITIRVAPDRDAAIRCALDGYDENEVYVSSSERHFRRALDKANAAKEKACDKEFSEALNELGASVAKLERVSHYMEQDHLTEEPALDFPGMVQESNIGEAVHYLTDGDLGTFVGDPPGQDKAYIFDFGENFKISAYRFGFRARLGFTDRTAGAQVYGSNDGESWVRLTVGEAPFTSRFSTVDVDEKYQKERYRYLKIKKTTEYPDVLRGSMIRMLEISEFRIWGARHEVH